MSAPGSYRPDLLQSSPLTWGTKGHLDWVLWDRWVKTPDGAPRRTPCLFTKGIWLGHPSPVRLALPVLSPPACGRWRDYVWTNMYIAWGLPPSSTYIQVSDKTQLCFCSLCVWERERCLSTCISLREASAPGQTRKSRWRKGALESEFLLRIICW